RSTVTATHGTAVTSAPTSAASVGARNWRTSLRLQRVGVEFVSDTADREEKLGRRIVPLDHLPEPPHVDVHRTRLHVHVLSPDEVEELQPIVHPVWVLHEELEKLEFTQREGQGLAVDGHLVGVEVDVEPAAKEVLLVRRRGGRGRGPA